MLEKRFHCTVEVNVFVYECNTYNKIIIPDTFPNVDVVIMWMLTTRVEGESA